MTNRQLPHPCLDASSILPAAVEYLQLRESEQLDDATLRKMLRECEDWFVWMDKMRRGLKSLAGRTEWDAMMRQETIAVIDAHDQLEAEAAIREVSRPRSTGREAKGGSAGPAGRASGGSRKSGPTV